MIKFNNIKAEKDNTNSSKKIKYLHNGSGVFVEQYALNYYKGQGLNGLISANDYWWTIMSLLFWDIIFANVRGAFTEVDGYLVGSDMPHDFFSDEFYSKRKVLIENRLKELESKDVIKLLEESYHKNYGIACRPIENWDKFSIAQLKEPLLYLNKESLRSILNRLLENFGCNRRGLPDLVVYDESKFIFVEVKSENDKISHDQILWADYISKELKESYEFLLINHSSTKVSNLNKKVLGSFKDVKISFGKSTSKKREEAIEFISSQPSYNVEGTGKEAIHSADFSTDNIESLYKMMDLITGVRSQKIYIDGQLITSTDLRSKLYCYKRKENKNKSLSYCNFDYYEPSRKNTLGCHNINIPELEHDRWTNYGFIDTETGDWKFDKEALQEDVNEAKARLDSCPVFKDEKINKALKSLPDTINPKKDSLWGYIADDGWRVWHFNNGTWHSKYKNDFPGINRMIGVKKLENKDYKYNSTVIIDDSYINSNNKPVRKNTKDINYLDGLLKFIEVLITTLGTLFIWFLKVITFIIKLDSKKR